MFFYNESRLFSRNGRQYVREWYEGIGSKEVSLLPAAYCLLPAACCLLPTACLLPGSKEVSGQQSTRGAQRAARAQAHHAQLACRPQDGLVRARPCARPHTADTRVLGSR